VTDTSVLSTLPRREFRSGLYEAVKYGMIARGGLLDRLATHLSAIFARDQQLLTSLVIDCCRIKAQIVSDDEHEGGPRRAFNLGHTVGHALETVTRYRRFAHGEAVAYGLMAASELSAARGTLSPEELARVRDVIRQMGPLPQVADLSIEETLQTIKRDKKVVAGTLHFVLPVTIGEVVTVKDVGEEELTAALRTIGMR
jgi:3-dehydroquinate synthase